MTVSPAQASGRPHREWLPIGLIGAAGLFLAALVALDTGGRGVALFALGAALGAVFLGFQYGFASAWRRFLTTGESMGLAAHFLLIGLVALVILPAAVLGLGGGLFSSSALRLLRYPLRRSLAIATAGAIIIGSIGAVYSLKFLFVRRDAA